MGSQRSAASDPRLESSSRAEPVALDVVEPAVDVVEPAVDVVEPPVDET